MSKFHFDILDAGTGKHLAWVRDGLLPENFDMPDCLKAKKRVRSGHRNGLMICNLVGGSGYLRHL